MATMTDTATRTAYLLALMKKGDDGFNARDFAAVDTVHHPDMVAHITGNAQPIYGKVAHAAAMQQMLRITRSTGIVIGAKRRKTSVLSISLRERAMSL